MYLPTDSNNATGEFQTLTQARPMITYIGSLPDGRIKYFGQNVVTLHLSPSQRHDTLVDY